MPVVVNDSCPMVQTVQYIYFLFTLQACVAVSCGRCICTVIPGSS